MGPEPAAAAIEEQGLGWKNTCGKGNAEDTMTSGLEGAWTQTPTAWSILYLDNLFRFDWEKQKSHTRDRLTDVDFVDNMVGYATGNYGIILKTTDGGSSWSNLNSGTTQHLSSVHFPVDADVGYVGGSGGHGLSRIDRTTTIDIHLPDADSKLAPGACM